MIATGKEAVHTHTSQQRCPRCHSAICNDHMELPHPPGELSIYLQQIFLGISLLHTSLTMVQTQLFSSVGGRSSPLVEPAQQPLAYLLDLKTHLNPAMKAAKSIPHRGYGKPCNPSSSVQTIVVRTWTGPDLDRGPGLRSRTFGKMAEGPGPCCLVTQPCTCKAACSPYNGLVACA